MFFKKYFLFFLLPVLSCTQKQVDQAHLATIRTANMVVGSPSLQVGTYRSTLPGYTALTYTAFAGNNQLSITSTTNSSTFYFDSTITLKKEGIYSLYIFGEMGKIENIFKEENIPAIYPDSTVGIRVINLSSGSPALNITQASNTKNYLFANLAYKYIPDFLRLPWPSVLPTSKLSFQVRKADNDSLLTTYSMPATTATNARFKNITLVVRGKYGINTGVDRFFVSLVTNYQ